MSAGYHAGVPKTDFRDGPYTVRRIPISMWPDREELRERMVISHEIINKHEGSLIASSETCCNEIAEAWNLKHAEWLMLQP